MSESSSDTSSSNSTTNTTTNNDNRVAVGNGGVNAGGSGNVIDVNSDDAIRAIAGAGIGVLDNVRGAVVDLGNLAYNQTRHVIDGQLDSFNSHASRIADMMAAQTQSQIMSARTLEGATALAMQNYAPPEATFNSSITKIALIAAAGAVALAIANKG